MFKLLFILIKCKWDYRLSHHRLLFLKALDLLLHLLQPTFYSLNFLYGLSIEPFRRRPDIFLDFWDVLWYFYRWLWYCLIFLFNF
jgi:hypothetical protein